MSGARAMPEDQYEMWRVKEMLFWPDKDAEVRYHGPYYSEGQAKAQRTARNNKSYYEYRPWFMKGVKVSCVVEHAFISAWKEIEEPDPNQLTPPGMADGDLAN